MADSPSPPPRAGATSKRSIKTSNGSSATTRNVVPMPKRNTSTQSKKSIATTTGASFSAVDWRMNISKLGLKLNIENDGGRDQFAMVSNNDLNPSVPQQPIPSPVGSVDSGPTNFTVEMEKYFAKDFNVESYKQNKAAITARLQAKITKQRQAQTSPPQPGEPQKSSPQPNIQRSSPQLQEPQHTSPSRSSRSTRSLISELSARRGISTFLNGDAQDSENAIEEETPATVLHHRLVSPSDNSTFAPNCFEPVMPGQNAPTYEQLLRQIEEMKQSHKEEIKEMTEEIKQIKQSHKRELKQVRATYRKEAQEFRASLEEEVQQIRVDAEKEKEKAKETGRLCEEMMNRFRDSCDEDVDLIEARCEEKVRRLEENEEKLKSENEDLKRENEDLQLVSQRVAEAALDRNEQQDEALALVEREREINEGLETELRELKAWNERIEKVLMYEWGKQECGPRKRADGTWGMGYRYKAPKDHKDPVLEAQRLDNEVTTTTEKNYDATRSRASKSKKHF